MTHWVGDVDDAVAESLLAEFEAELDETYSGWATSVDPDTQGSAGASDVRTVRSPSV